MLPLSALITAFAQLGVLLVLPAAWWALTARRSLGFAAWIGLMHVALFASFVPPLPLALIGAVTAANGWITGWINEECAGGSIVPSWLLHATANLAVGWGAAFGLLS